jgi:cysteine sulfinate desulfinase/cysteine desulfurase-like protein
VAKALNAKPEENFFTSWARRRYLGGAGRRRTGRRQGKRHIVTTAFEHHAVLLR